jgi:hypothetical protein
MVMPEAADETGDLDPRGPRDGAHYTRERTEGPTRARAPTARTMLGGDRPSAHVHPYARRGRRGSEGALRVRPFRGRRC